MANSSGTRASGIAKGGYNPKPFRNETGMKRVHLTIPHRFYDRMMSIAKSEGAPIDNVANHIIAEYFKAIDGIVE